MAFNPRPIAPQPAGTPMQTVVEEDGPIGYFVPRPPTPFVIPTEADWERLGQARLPQAAQPMYLDLPQAISPWLLTGRSPLCTPPVFAPPSGPAYDAPEPDYFAFAPQPDPGPVHDSAYAWPYLGPMPTADTPLLDASPSGPAAGTEAHSPAASHASLGSTPSEPGGAAGPSPRQMTRSVARHDLVRKPLHQSYLGRSILALQQYAWFTLSNGLVVMRFDEGESHWRANDMANCINWLRCGAYCHRSSTHNVIAIANLDALNQRIVASGARPIVPLCHPPAWRFHHRRPEPTFMRHTFISRHLPAGRWL